MTPTSQVAGKQIVNGLRADYERATVNPRHRSVTQTYRQPQGEHKTLHTTQQALKLEDLSAQGVQKKMRKCAVRCYETAARIPSDFYRPR